MSSRAGGYKAECGDEPVYECRANDPAKRHDRPQEKKYTFPVPPHVCFGQFDSHSKHLNDEDNTGQLEGDLVCVSPCEWIK